MRTTSKESTMKSSNLLFGKQRAFFEHSKKLRNQSVNFEAFEILKPKDDPDEKNNESEKEQQKEENFDKQDIFKRFYYI